MFLMSAMLLGLGLLALPFLVHLLNRQKVVPIQWGAMQFLLETPLKMRRQRSISNWLLMLVRMAILAMLVFLLARPLLKGTSVASQTPFDVGIVIDHSLSMGRRGTERTLFEQAVAEVEHIANILPADATLSVTLAEATPRVLTPVPISLANRAAGSDYARLMLQLQQTKPGQTFSSIPTALQAANESVARGRNVQKLIIILSDDHRPNWQIENTTAWRAAVPDPLRNSVPIYSLPTDSAAAAANVAATTLTVGEGLVGVNRPTAINATFTNTGSTDAASVPVTFIVDGRTIGTQTIAALPAGQSTTLRLDHYFNEPGSHWIKVQTDIVDGLAADNATVTAVHVLPKLPVLIVDGQLSGVGTFANAAFLQAAVQPVDTGLESTTLLQPRVISVADLPATSLDAYPLIVLNDVPRLPQDLANRIAAHISRGNGLWLILGPRTQRDAINDVLAKTTPAPLLPARIANLGNNTTTHTTIDITSPEHPTMALLVAAERNALAGAAVTQWHKLELQPGVRPVLATVTGDPLVIDHDVGTSGGRIITWATSVDAKWSNLPLLPNFVPLANETLYHLAAPQAATQVYQLDAGETLLWSSPPNTRAVESVRMIRPDGTHRDLAAQLRGDRYLLSTNDTTLPGLYQLQFTPSAVSPPVYYAVSFDRRELETTSLSISDTESLKQAGLIRDRLTRDTLASALAASPTGTELYPLLGLLVLALLVTEVFLTRQHMRKQLSIKPEDAGLVTKS